MSASVVLPADWGARVAAVLTACGESEAAAAPIRLLGAGMDSTAVLAGDLVLRMPRAAAGAATLERERAVLPVLADALPLPVPRFRHLPPNPLGPGVCCVYRAVPGDSLDDEQWHERGLLAAPAPARQVGEFLAALHAFPVERAAALGLEVWDLRAEFAADLAGIRASVLPLLDRAEAALLLRLWEEYLADDANFAYRPTVIHADVSLDHLLVTGAEISGVIDFGDIAISDPAYDLCYLWTDAGPDFVGRVCAAAGIPLDDRLIRKLRFWSCSDPAFDVLHGLENGMDDFTVEHLGYLRAALANH